MREVFILYAFLGLMVFNLLATFLYLTGIDGARAAFRRFLRRAQQKPR